MVLLTFCGFKKLAIFTTNVDAENQTLLTTNVSAKHEPPPIANVLLAAVILFIIVYRFEFQIYCFEMIDIF